MKKTAFIFAAAGLLAAGVSASAEIGDVVGHVYSTDILATVNGEPIPSYSLDGKTAIALRDLENYGFLVGYTDDARVSIAEFSTSRPITPIEGVERGSVGEIVGEVLETDIVAYINGEYVPTYNIGGRLVAAIEDIAPWNDGSGFAAYGYAKTGMTYIWDEDNRTVELKTLPIETDSEAWKKAREYGRHMRLDGSRIVVEENKLDWPVLNYEYSSSWSMGDEQIRPITYIRNDGTEEEVGLYYSFKRVTWDIGAPTVNISEGREMTYTVLDAAKLEEIFASEEPYKRSFTEELAFYTGGRSGIYGWRVNEQIDAENCTILLLRNTGLMNSSDPVYRLLRIDRDPVSTELILTEQIAAPELYGDELYYFKGTSIYKMNIYDKTEEELAPATYENITAYITEYHNILHEYRDGENAFILAERNGDVSVYAISADGISMRFRGSAEEVYAKDDEAVVYDGGTWLYVTIDGASEDRGYIERLKAEGERLI